MHYRRGAGKGRTVRIQTIRLSFLRAVRTGDPLARRMLLSGFSGKTPSDSPRLSLSEYRLSLSACLSRSIVLISDKKVFNASITMIAVS